MVAMAGIAQQKTGEREVLPSGVKMCRFAAERGDVHLPLLIKSAADLFLLAFSWNLIRSQTSPASLPWVFSTQLTRKMVARYLSHPRSDLPEVFPLGCIHHFQLGAYVFFPGLTIDGTTHFSSLFLKISSNQND